MTLNNIIESLRTNLVSKPYDYYNIASSMTGVLTNLIDQKEIDPKGFRLTAFRKERGSEVVIAFMDKNYNRYPLFIVNVSKKKGQTHHPRWSDDYTDYTIKDFTLDLPYNTPNFGDTDFDDVLTKAIDDMNGSKKCEQERLAALHDAVVKIKEAMGYEKESQVHQLVHSLYDKRYNDVVFPNRYN